MLTLESLEILLAVDENQMLDELTATLLAAPQLTALLDRSPRLKAALHKDLPQWQAALKQRLRDTPAPPELERELTCYQRSGAVTPREFHTRLPAIVTTLNTVESPFLPQATKLIKHIWEEGVNAGFQSLFLQRWKLSLTLQTVTLHSRLLEQERDIFLTELQQRLSLSQQLEPVLAENETAAGRLWDLCAGKLLRAEYRPLLDLGEFLRRQPSLRQLAERLGRIRETHAIVSRDAPPEVFSIAVREPALVPEQVNGVHQSDDILRLLPAELATVDVAELEYEFYRRLLEHRLLTYRLQGEAWRKKRIERPIALQRKQQQPQGPFIVCVDTSGSMGGFNERCAKAFCLALLRIALADGRRCHIMLFSSGLVSYEPTAADGLDQALRFLNQTFRGGTDLAACLDALASKMDETGWRDADAVVISDFIAQRLPEEVTGRIRHLQRAHRHRFHAVAMSDHGKPGIMRIFDHIWHFDTGLKSRVLRRLRHPRPVVGQSSPAISSRVS